MQFLGRRNRQRHAFGHGSSYRACAADVGIQDYVTRKICMRRYDGVFCPSYMHNMGAHSVTQRAPLQKALRDVYSLCILFVLGFLGDPIL